MAEAVPSSGEMARCGVARVTGTCVGRQAGAVHAARRAREQPGGGAGGDLTRRGARQPSILQQVARLCGVSLTLPLASASGSTWLPSRLRSATAHSAASTPTHASVSCRRGTEGSPAHGRRQQAAAGQNQHAGTSMPPGTAAPSSSTIQQQQQPAHLLAPVLVQRLEHDGQQQLDGVCHCQGPLPHRLLQRLSAADLRGGTVCR